MTNGAIPWVIPDVLSSGESGAGSAGWADAGTIIPWTLYLAYGDTRILEVQYESMQAWVAYMRAQAGDDLVWNSGFHFGDWLAYSTTNPAYPGATTGTDVIATSSFQSPTMNSFNHYSYGAVGDWMYRVLAGSTRARPRPATSMSSSILAPAAA